MLFFAVLLPPLLHLYQQVLKAMAERVGDAIKKIADHVQTEVLEDCGHYVPEEQPEVLN